MPFPPSLRCARTTTLPPVVFQFLILAFLILGLVFIFLPFFFFPFFAKFSIEILAPRSFSPFPPCYET